MKTFLLSCRFNVLDAAFISWGSNLLVQGEFLLGLALLVSGGLLSAYLENRYL